MIFASKATEFALLVARGYLSADSGIHWATKILLVHCACSSWGRSDEKVADLEHHYSWKHAAEVYELQGQMRSDKVNTLQQLSQDHFLTERM